MRLCRRGASVGAEPSGQPGHKAEVIVLPGASSAEGIAAGRGATFYAGEQVAGDIFRGNLQRDTVWRWSTPSSTPAFHLAPSSSRWSWSTGDLDQASGHRQVGWPGGRGAGREMGHCRASEGAGLFEAEVVDLQPVRSAAACQQLTTA